MREKIMSREGRMHKVAEAEAEAEGGGGAGAGVEL